MVPAELRERADFHAGRRLILVETPNGILLLTREQLKAMVRRDVEGLDLVTELIAERRQAAAAERAS